MFQTLWLTAAGKELKDMQKWAYSQATFYYVHANKGDLDEQAGRVYCLKEKFLFLSCCKRFFINPNNLYFLFFLLSLGKIWQDVLEISTKFKT